MVLNPSNVISSLQKNAYKIGGVVGYLQTFNFDLGTVADELSKILSAPRFPALKEIVKRAPTDPNFKNGVMLAVIGYILKETKLPIVGKYGPALFNGGIGIVGGVTLAHATAWSHNPGTGAVRSSSNTGNIYS